MSLAQDDEWHESCKRKRCVLETGRKERRHEGDGYVILYLLT
jgi:hypothetical protein